MKKDERKVLKRFAKAVKLYSVTSDASGTIKLVFLDAQGRCYIHFQKIPSECNEKCRSKAYTYMCNLKQAHALQGGRIIPYEELLPDATDGMKIRAAKELENSYFLVDVCVRKMGAKYGNRTYFDADYVDYLPPSKAARESLAKFECSDQYKEMILKRRKSEDILDYFERINSEIKTFETAEA